MTIPIYISLERVWCISYARVEKYVWEISYTCTIDFEQKKTVNCKKGLMVVGEQGKKCSII